MVSTLTMQVFQHLTPMLPLAMIILPAPPINTLIADLDKSNPPLTASTTGKNAIGQRMRCNRELVPLKLPSDFFRVVSCCSRVRLL